MVDFIGRYACDLCGRRYAVLSLAEDCQDTRCIWADPDVDSEDYDDYDDLEDDPL